MTRQPSTRTAHERDCIFRNFGGYCTCRPAKGINAPDPTVTFSRQGWHNAACWQKWAADPRTYDCHCPEFQEPEDDPAALPAEDDFSAAIGQFHRNQSVSEESNE